MNKDHKRIIPQSIDDTQLCNCWGCLLFEKKMAAKHKGWSTRQLMDWGFENARKGTKDRDFQRWGAHSIMMNSTAADEWFQLVKAQDMFMFTKGVLGWSAADIVKDEEFQQLEEKRMKLEKEVGEAPVEGLDMAVYQKIRAQF
jgi:hypothetical protein